MVCCIIGHRKIEINDELISKLKNVFEDLILKGYCEFWLGSRSEFDDLCHKILKEFKREYKICIVYVRAEYVYDENIMKYLLKDYDKTFFPDCVRQAGKLRYITRNEYMIKNCDICLFYYNLNYKLKNLLTSGTKIAYDFAVSRKKELINTFDSSPHKKCL